jgi:DNA-binding response OmpR family regulator
MIARQGFDMSILGFGNEQDFHTAIAKACKKFDSTVEHAESSDVAGFFFDAIKPELVVFCFDGVDKAEVGLKALYAHSEIAAFTDFTTLLLCTKNETETALNLCLKGVFKDYIIAKPLQDGAQLEWRIQALLSAYQAKRVLPRFHGRFENG